MEDGREQLKCRKNVNWKLDITGVTESSTGLFILLGGSGTGSFQAANLKQLNTTRADGQCLEGSRP